MRVTGPHVADLAPLCAEVNWGKWNAHIDLRTDEGKMKLRELVEEADVVVDGYRPGVMDKYGFGKQGILDITKERKKGIIYLRENCYVSRVDYREAVGRYSLCMYPGLEWSLGTPFRVAEYQRICEFKTRYFHTLTLNRAEEHWCCSRVRQVNGHRRRRHPHLSQRRFLVSPFQYWSSHIFSTKSAARVQQEHAQSSVP